MKTVIYYYTGTGNSLWCARSLAGELKDAELVSLVADPAGLQATGAEAVGMVFPVHLWGVPRAVLEFVSRLPQGAEQYYFALAVNAGQVSATLRQLQKILARRVLKLSLGFSLRFPSNYTPWGGPGTAEYLEQCFHKAREKIRSRVVPAIRRRKSEPVEQGPLWQKILFTGIYKLSFPHIAQMDKSFWTDAACNGCALCVKLCPAANIILEAKRPVWRHHCQQCLACLQWCPRQAIQFGKKTPGIPRYHHPEITSADMQRSAPGK